MMNQPNERFEMFVTPSDDILEKNKEKRLKNRQVMDALLKEIERTEDLLCRAVASGEETDSVRLRAQLDELKDERTHTAVEADLIDKEYNERLLELLPVEEKHRQFNALIAKLDGSKTK